MEYILVAIICFVLGIFYNKTDRNKFDTQIMKHLRSGKRVIICVDDEATIMERAGDQISITKAVMNFSMETENGLENVDSSGSTESSYPGPCDIPH